MKVSNDLYEHFPRIIVFKERKIERERERKIGSEKSSFYLKPVLKQLTMRTAKLMLKLYSIVYLNMFEDSSPRLC